MNPTPTPPWGPLARDLRGRWVQGDGLGRGGGGAPTAADDAERRAPRGARGGNIGLVEELILDLKSVTLSLHLYGEFI